MKIRIQNQKLIYRLQNEDLAFLEQNNYCEESLSVNDFQLLFSLQSSNIEQEQMIFENTKIQVIIPKNVMQEWLDTAQIEIEFLVGKTQVIIEKDLKEFRRHASR